ncbi:MAG: UDP-3-O-(3-hydroxymyristoyl)glucosamine N-acyltransferase [Wenzhouxiangellaceae bacterium]|nr:UDP-3-O-(3-hydroxymyristoyl)glucosamine N-acyltransferase [Wenzhouxiangellaceae bacterium]
MKVSEPRIRQAVALGELADRLELPLHGDRKVPIESAATLARATAGQISFLANPAYREQLRSTQAAAVIVSASALDDCPCPALTSETPYAAWARLLGMLYPPAPLQAGIDSSARVSASAQIDSSAEIGAFCQIGPGARIGPDVLIGPGSIIGAEVEIGAGSRLVARVCVDAAARLGERVLIQPGAVIGSDGFGLAMHDGKWLKVAQLGSVRIGDDCEIGANTTIDRGAIEDTVLGCDVRLDNQVQVAHNVQIGDHTAIAGCVGIAGSTSIGKYCMIAGASGIGGHLRICDHVVITAMSAVLHSIESPGQYGSGIPARPMRSWQRILVRLSQLERLFRRPRP